MRNIEKGGEPESLRTHRTTTPHAEWDKGYHGKREAFAALCNEQGYLCAYCMSRIKPDQRPRKIDHWIPQSHHPASPHAASVHEENRLSWSNLLGVCPGGAGPPEAPEKTRTRALQHCDTYRGNAPLNIHPALDKGPMGELFQYGKDGEIHSRDPAAAHDIETLNLNFKWLRRNRRNVLVELRRSLRVRPGQWTKKQLRAELAKWQQRTSKVRYTDGKGQTHTAMGFREYNEVAISFLTRQIRKRPTS